MNRVGLRSRLLPASWNLHLDNWQDLCPTLIPPPWIPSSGFITQHRSPLDLLDLGGARISGPDELKRRGAFVYRSPPYEWSAPRYFCVPPTERSAFVKRTGPNRDDDRGTFQGLKKGS